MLLPFGVLGQTGGKPLTDDDVIAMVKAGLAESTVINAVKAQDTSFDVSAAALIKLKQQGVSPKIMSAMMEAVKKTTSGPAYAAAEPEPLKTTAQNPGNLDYEGIPQPDYVSLFKLYMSSNSDIMNTDAFAWDYHLVFRGPAAGTKECYELSEKLRNEIARADLIRQAHSELAEGLKFAPQWPKKKVFRLRTNERLDNYNLNTQEFPLLPGVGNFSVRVASPIIEIPKGRWVFADSTGRHAPPPLTCSTNSYSWKPETYDSPGRAFVLALSGGEKINLLPMPRIQAQAYLDARRERSVDIEVLVEVGPALSQPGRRNSIPARVIAARALEPRTGQTLHVFDPALFAQSSAALTATVATGADETSFPMTPYRVGLLTLKDVPSTMSDKFLRDFTKAQIIAEQSFFKSWDRRWSGDPHNPHPGQFRPKDREFFFEWQRLEQEKPELANGALMGVYLRPDPDWSFVKQDKRWDDRKEAAVEVFLFAEESIRGRDPEFVAHELTSVTKSQLELAAAKAPRNLWLDVQLPAGDYDFESKAIRFWPVGTSGGKFADRIDLLQPIREPAYTPFPREGRAFGMTLPLDAGTKLAYFKGDYERLLKEPSTTRPGAQTQTAPMGPLLADSWRQHFWPSSGQLLPYLQALAFDRQLQIGSIAIDEKTAEKLRAKMQSLRARVYFQAERIELGEQAYEQTRTPVSVLFARLIKIDITTIDGERVASWGPEAFRPAKDVLAAAATAQAKANAEKKAKEAEDAANRKKSQDAFEAQQRQIKDDVRRQSEEGSKELQEKANQRVEQSLAHVKKQRECDGRAFKVNNDRSSSAYKEVYDACMQEK